LHPEEVRAMVMARRGFILTTTSLLVLGTGSTLLPRTASAAGGKYGIELDGNRAGWVWSVEGGQLLSDTDVGQQLTIAVDEASPRLIEWMQPGARRSGAVINASTGERLEFTDALITELGFPALDAASTDTARLTLRIWPPKGLRRVPGPALKSAPLAAVQKRWSPADFRIRIDGLDKPCASVSKIDALTIKQKLSEQDVTKEPGKLEFPNLVITLPESAELAAWTRAFAARQTGPRAGTLSYLADDGVTARYIVVMNSIRPLKLVPDKLESGSDQVRRVRAELHCEDMRVVDAT
jgi:hypothetical protein